MSLFSKTSKLTKRPGNIDLLDLPGFRWFVGTWRTLIFANGAVRRDAKALLFAELAEAARRGMPMALALELASETEKQEKHRRGRPEGPEGWASGIGTIAVLAMWVAINLGILVYAIFSWRFADPARVARLLAWKLKGKVEKGMSLSDAMRACGQTDFHPEEKAIVAAGERQGTLPSALAQLSDFMVTENRVAVMGTHALTPLLYMGIIFFPVVWFIAAIIAPKFRDVHTQLGSELPGITNLVFGLWDGWGALASLFSCLVFAFFGLRAMMNGSRSAQFMVALTGAFAISGAGFALAGIAMENCSTGFALGLGIVGVGFLVTVLALFTLPAVLALIEKVILEIEHAASPLLQVLPFVGAAQRAQAEARWMASLGVALDAGVPPHEALAAAAAASGGWIGKSTLAAANLASKGIPIGEACRRCGVLRPAVNHQLALVDWKGDYADGLRAIAEDTSFRATETLRRSARVAEVFMMATFAVLAFLIIMAVYLPMFNIPAVVGRQGIGS